MLSVINSVHSTKKNEKCFRLDKFIKHCSLNIKQLCCITLNSASLLVICQKLQQMTIHFLKVSNLKI